MVGPRSAGVLVDYCGRKMPAGTPALPGLNGGYRCYVYYVFCGAASG